MKHLLVVAFSAIAAGCVTQAPTDFACTAELRSNITVIARDSLTNAPAAIGAAGNVVSGTYNNTLTIANDSVLYDLKQEHPGTFRVTVTKPGYNDWVRNDVVVTADECHVTTTTVRALLVKVP